MDLKRKIKHALILAGWKPSRRLNWPVGVDWKFDLDYYLGASEMDVILDVGANIGQTAIECHKLFKSARIFSFEPVRATFEQASKNIAHLPRIEIVNQALGDCVGELEISVHAHSVGSSLKNNTGGIAKEMVKVSTVDTFFKERQLDRIGLLKIDTEGFEMEVLKGAEGVLREGKVDFIFVEAGMDPLDGGHTYLGRLMDDLGRHRFRAVGFYDQSEPWIPTPFLNILLRRV